MKKYFTAIIPALVIALILVSGAQRPQTTSLEPPKRGLIDRILRRKTVKID